MDEEWDRPVFRSEVYGTAVARCGIATISCAPIQLHEQLGLTPMQAVVASFAMEYISHKGNTADKCWVVLEALGDRSGFKYDYVRKAMAQLVKLGLVGQAGNKGNTKFFDFSPILKRMEDILKEQENDQVG